MVQARRRPVAPIQPPASEPIMAAPGVAGFAVLAVVSGNLGLPLPGAYLAVDVLFVALGFDLARGADPATRPTGHDGRWLKFYWLSLIVRIAAPVTLAVMLTAFYENSQAPLDESMTRAVLGALTMSLNLFTIFGEARFPAIEHFWVVAIIGQFALIAPVLAACGHGRFRRDQRASAIVGLAVGVAICRFGFAASQTAAYSSIAMNTLTRVDGLLVGLAIGVAPIGAVRRRVPPGLAAAAFAVLLVLLLAAPSQADRPLIALGVLVPIAVVLSAVMVASVAAGALTGAMSSTFDNHLIRWLGARALSLYVWHQIFGFALQVGLLGTPDTMTQWPGLAIFVLRVIFTLAAAATSYRYLELPALSAARQIAERTADRRRAARVA